MKTLYTGKTKDVLTDEASGDAYLLFKDSATGENGVFDPGSNTVGGNVPGKGKTGLQIAAYFFKKLESDGVPTHFLGADIEKGLMKVRRITVPPLEFILRYFTAGSLCRRFSLPEGVPFDPPYAEVTLKDDANGDPLISQRLCHMKGLLTPKQYESALILLFRVGETLKKELHALGFTLIDFKIELGYDKDGKIYVADEVTPDVWRAKDQNGRISNQIDGAKAILEKIQSL